MDFLGTDTHKTYYRPPGAEMELKWLYEHMGQDDADALAWGNARKLLCDNTRKETQEI